LIIANLADVRAAATKIGKPGNSIRYGTTGHFSRRSHLQVNIVCLVFIDECHRTERRTDSIEKGLVDVCEHINNCIADAE